MTLAAASACATRRVLLANVIALVLLPFSQSIAGTTLAEASEIAPITEENCMAFSPARRAASGIPCIEKQPLEIKRTSTTGPKSSTAVAAVANPILFVTQVPTAGEIFASRTSIFANHRPEIESVPRGGDLMIRYADGTLKNLTALAGYGQSGQQGANAIAVRDPSVHWSGNKALFSMVVGAPVNQYVQVNTRWQLMK